MYGFEIKLHAFPFGYAYQRGFLCLKEEQEIIGTDEPFVLLFLFFVGDKVSNK